MPTFLEEIVERKKIEVAQLRDRLSQQEDHPINEVIKQGKVLNHERRFENALKSQTLSIIAEIKRRSPSVGQIGEIADPSELAKKYEAGGASCISCLTDYASFGGSIEDLKSVTAAVSIPVLRKDFLVDTVQIAEAKEAGADAVLLIVACLGEKTGQFLEEAECYGLCALVEVHDVHELGVAVKCGARIVGVNARNLHTFEIDLSTCEEVMRVGVLPSTMVMVAESGISGQRDACRMRNAGYDAVLVGKALVESKDVAKVIESFKIPPES